MNEQSLIKRLGRPHSFSLAELKAVTLKSIPSSLDLYIASGTPAPVDLAESFPGFRCVPVSRRAGVTGLNQPINK